MNSKIWIIMCLLFLAYNLVLLFEDYYSVNFKVLEERDQLYDNITLYSACSEFEFFRKNTEERLNKRFNVTIPPAEQKVSLRNFVNYSIVIIETRLGTSNLFRPEQGYVFKNHVCFWINLTFYAEHPLAREFLKVFRVQLFAYSRGKRPFFYEYVFNNFFSTPGLIIKKQKIYDRNYLDYTSRCGTHRSQYLSSRFDCLRMCSPALDLLELHEHDRLDLKWIIDKRFFRKKRDAGKHKAVKLNIRMGYYRNVTYFEHFRKCLKECPDNDCFVESYSSIIVPTSKTLGDIDLETTIYTAYYSTSYFWLQLFGLLTLFTNTSVTFTLPLLIGLSAKRLRESRQAHFRWLLPKIKLLLIILSSLLILAQSYLMVRTYAFERSYPNKTIILDYSSPPFWIHICLPVEILFNNDSKRIVKGRNSEILENFTLAELENQTNVLGKGVEEIRLLHRSETKTLNWAINEKVLFKASTFDQQNGLSRCFRVEIDFDDLRYRRSMPFYFLEIKFRTRFREVFLTEQKQSLSSGLVDFKGDFFVKKVTNRMSAESRKSNCTDMKAEGCDSVQHCIDRCYNKKFLQEHSAFPSDSVLEMDDFNSTVINEFKFKQGNHIRENCTKLFRNRNPCRSARFEPSLKRINSFDENSVKISLNYEHSISEEIEQSFIMLILNILNLESIFFRNNVASCLLFGYSLLKQTCKLKWRTINRFLLFSICLLGFSMHNFFVFKGIVNEQLVHSGYFVKLDRFKLPNVVFCIDLGKLQIDGNHKMSGRYLDELTKELDLGKIFTQAHWFNKTHWKWLNLVGLRSNNYTHPDISISSFYLSTFKCFEFDLKIEFREEDFIVLTNKFILAVHFNVTFVNFANRTALFYRNAGDEEFSDFLEYSLGKNRWGKRVIYEMVLERITVERMDVFEGLKNPLSLLYRPRMIDDKNIYLREMREKFRGSSDLTSTAIPLEHDDSDRTVDNEMFEQFYLQVMNVTDHRYPISLNSKQTFYNYYSKKLGADNRLYFQFTLLSVGRKIEILNGENYPKLIQDILNTLSLFLSIGIIDIVTYINMAPNLLLKLYRVLIAVRGKFLLFFISLEVKPDFLFDATGSSRTKSSIRSNRESRRKGNHSRHNQIQPARAKSA